MSKTKSQPPKVLQSARKPAIGWSPDKAAKLREAASRRGTGDCNCNCACK